MCPIDLSIKISTMENVNLIFLFIMLRCCKVLNMAFYDQVCENLLMQPDVSGSLYINKWPKIDLFIAPM